MKVSLFWIIAFVSGLSLLISGAAAAQPVAISNAPIAQPLVREGNFAVNLVNALQLSTTTDESTAESALASAGIAPKNGWIADYPVTPDIAGELQASISSAASSGKLPIAGDAALAAFEDILAANNMPLKAGGVPGTVAPSGENYPDENVINNYYYEAGPPVLTYYAPPPDYAYLYTWVPYPFWWENLWFPGYYCLSDFDMIVFYHHHREFLTNHFRNPATGRVFRINPATGGFFARGGARVLGPAAQRGAQSILGRGVVRAAPGNPGQFRGFLGTERPLPGTRSGAFQRWGGNRFEGQASTRGFQSRSRAGQLPGRAPSGGGFGAFHGSGHFTGGGGGAPHGGGGSRR